ncbi:MAG TPA: hypothetical protein VGN17_10915 [Bryobacteraceae bacterium]|jgi:hypothetical protein
MRHQAILYPLGHPVEIRTNSESVLDLARASFDEWPSYFCGAPARFEIEVHEGAAPAEPPRFEGPPGRFRLWYDDANGGQFDFAERTGRVRVATALVPHPQFRHDFFVPLVLTALDSIFFTPLHAACVAREGRGVLLCGDSGAGKSTLSYALARRGWTFLSDDVVHLTPGRQRVGVSGSALIHLREPSRRLFDELGDVPVGTAPNRKKAMEIDAARQGFRTARHAIVEKCFFLNRRPGPARKRDFDVESALAILLRALVPRDTTAIEPRLREFLSAAPLSLEYETVDDAVALIEDAA